MEQFNSTAPLKSADLSGVPVEDGPYSLLRNLTYFDGVSDSELAAVAALMRPRSYAAGEFIYRQGTPTDGMYVIEEGSVQLWSKVADSVHKLPRLGPGNVVCESAIAEANSRILNAECLTATRTWVLDIASFDTLRSRAHPAAYAMLLVAARSLSLTLRSAMGHWGQLRFDHAPTLEIPRACDPTPEGRAWGPADYPVMRVLPGFKAWSDQALATLATVSRLVEVPRGLHLLGEGQPSGSIWWVVRGAMEVSTTRPSGRYRHGLRGPDLLVGQEAAIDGLPQLADCTAKEKTLLLEIPRASLDALIAARDPIAGPLLSQICGCVSREFGADCRHFSKCLSEMDVQPSTSLDEMRGEPSRRST